MEIDDDGNISFYEDTGTTPQFRWDAVNERLGIGTSSPSNVLHIVSTNATAILQRTTAVGNNSGLSTFDFKNSDSTVSSISNFNKSGSTISTGVDGYELRLSNFGNGYTSFFNDGSETMRINSSGNVGIATTSPAHKISIGTYTATSTATPDTISLGATYSSTAGQNLKLRLFYNNSTISHGFGISNGQIDYVASGAGVSHVWYSNSSERMRIDSSGNVGIGTSSPSHALQVSSKFAVDTSNSFGRIYLGRPVSPNLSTMMIQGTDVSETSNTLSMINNSGAGMSIELDSSVSAIVFNVDGASSERMRITNDRLLVNTTGTNIGSSTAGCQLETAGTAAFSRGANHVLTCNRFTNDGDIVLLQQAGTTEGSISVSGTTVSYNGFTGSHWSRFTDESKPNVLRGTVMESLDQMTDWYNVEFTDNENNLQKKPYALKANEQEGDVITYAWEKKDEEGNDIIEQVQATIVKQVDVKHVMSKISDTVEAKNVYGVFSAWDNDDLINNDFYVASVGSFVVRIKAGQVVSKGDLLQSNGDGTAKVQADDIIRASTFAKVLSNTVIETYEDGSFIVPCSLMC
jgi:hypothetical protein